MKDIKQVSELRRAEFDLLLIDLADKKEKESEANAARLAAEAAVLKLLEDEKIVLENGTNTIAGNKKGAKIVVPVKYEGDLEEITEELQTLAQEYATQGIEIDSDDIYEDMTSTKTEISKSGFEKMIKGMTGKKKLVPVVKALNDLFKKFVTEKRQKAQLNVCDVE